MITAYELHVLTGQCHCVALEAWHQSTPVKHAKFRLHLFRSCSAHTTATLADRPCLYALKCLCVVLNELSEFRPMVSQLLQTAEQQHIHSLLPLPTLVTQSYVSLVSV